MTSKAVKILIQNLIIFSEQELKKYPAWRKGQALYSCATIAFPNLLKQITGTKDDCYYEDCKIPKFFEAFQKTLKTEKPFVGIFWFFYGLPLFVHAVHISEGLHYDKAITGIKDHADYWEENAGSKYLPEPLKNEYFSIPRGRVVYHENTDTFTVYHGNNMTKQDLQEVAAVFCLPKSKTKFEKDIHYCDLTEDEWGKVINS